MLTDKQRSLYLKMVLEGRPLTSPECANLMWKKPASGNSARATVMLKQMEKKGYVKSTEQGWVTSKSK